MIKIVPPAFLDIAADLGPLADAAPSDKGTSFQDLLAKVVPPDDAGSVASPNGIPEAAPAGAAAPEAAKTLPGVELPDAAQGTRRAKKEDSEHADDASPVPAAVAGVWPHLEAQSRISPTAEARPEPGTAAVLPREAARHEKPLPKASAAAETQDPAEPAEQPKSGASAEAPKHASRGAAIFAAGDHPLPPIEARPAAPSFASMLSLEHTNPAAAPPASAPHVAALRVGEPGWEGELGAKVVWMASRRQQVAELRVNPPELGPLKITLSLDDDKASAQFVSPHAPVRAALEQALPQLQHMLAQNGITLSNATVGSESFPDRPQAQGREPAPHTTGASDADLPRGASQPLRALHGLVDTFA